MIPTKIMIADDQGNLYFLKVGKNTVINGITQIVPVLIPATEVVCKSCEGRGSLKTFEAKVSGVKGKQLMTLRCDACDGTGKTYE